jgi:hypothetical protein
MASASEPFALLPRLTVFFDGKVEAEVDGMVRITGSLLYFATTFFAWASFVQEVIT